MQRKKSQIQIQWIFLSDHEPKLTIQFESIANLFRFLVLKECLMLQTSNLHRKLKKYSYETSKTHKLFAPTAIRKASTISKSKPEWCWKTMTFLHLAQVTRLELLPFGSLVSNNRRALWIFLFIFHWELGKPAAN